jgi:hypothetical protein
MALFLPPRNNLLTLPTTISLTFSYLKVLVF